MTVKPVELKECCAVSKKYDKMIINGQKRGKETGDASSIHFSPFLYCYGAASCEEGHAKNLDFIYTGSNGFL